MQILSLGFLHFIQTYARAPEISHDYLFLNYLQVSNLTITIHFNIIYFDAVIGLSRYYTIAIIFMRHEWQTGGVDNVLVGRHEVKRPFGRPSRR